MSAFDQFDEKVPGFTLQGESMINTRVGSLCSIFILLTSLTYGIFKF